MGIGEAAPAFTGLLYFAIVFALAFAMGIFRTLIVAPRIGRTAAVLIEVPLILVASWFVARRLLRDRAFSLSQRAAMGLIAFGLTLISEAALSSIMRGQGVLEWAATVATPLGLVGLTGQLGFGLMPIVAGLGRSRPR